MNLFIDFETIPSQRPDVMERIKSKISPPGTIKKPESVEKWYQENGEAAIENEWRKTALNSTLGEIVSVAWAINDGEVKGIIRSHEGSESVLINEFFTQLLNDLKDDNGYTRPITRWIGHNISGFDIRYLWHRCIVNRIKSPVKIPVDAKPWDGEIFDTMNQWAGFKDRISQDDLCFALGIEGKPSDIDGSKVWDFVKAGKLVEVVEYNKDDVFKVREIYKRLTFS